MGTKVGSKWTTAPGDCRPAAWKPGGLPAKKLVWLVDQLWALLEDYCSRRLLAYNLEARGLAGQKVSVVSRPAVGPTRKLLPMEAASLQPGGLGACRPESERGE